MIFSGEYLSLASVMFEEKYMSTKVLIIDDEVETCRMLSTALELFGYVPLTALSGAEALETIDGNPPDVVVLDLMMPGMDGFEVTKRMRAHRNTKTTPIIIVTAMGEIDAEERSLSCGATAFMRKPVSIGNLAETIQRVSS